MICKHCNTENPDDRQLCLQCGKELDGAATPDDSVGVGPTIPPKDGPPKDVPPDTPVPRPNSIGNVTTINVRADSPLAKSTAESTGDVIGDNYEIIERIGRGGMGVVYRARDRKLGREVAVKRLLAPEDSARLGIERFLQEARAIAFLNHRNIVTIYELGEDDDGPFIVMEHLPGGNLESLIREGGRLELRQALSIIKGVGQALAYAHRRSVVHRDVKPSNIILTEDGTPKLLDFGLAQMARESELSKSGYGMGTLPYMPPEQRRDAKRADHRSDIYALAKTLYHMVTGELPDAIDLDMVSAEIRPAIKRALKPKPEDRPFSMDEFLQDMENPAAAGTPGAGVTAQPGACPNCGNANPEDIKFCRSCGAGLFDKCPKCGAEDRVGIRHCGSCGVSIIRYREAQEALANAQEHLEAFRYGRAIKEADRGLQAGHFRDELKALRRDAAERRDRLDALRLRIDKLIEEEKYEEVQEPLRDALELDPGNEALKALLDDLPERIKRRDVEKLLAEAASFLDRKKYEEAQDPLRKALEIDPDNQNIAALLEEAEAKARQVKVDEAISQAMMLIELEQYEAAKDPLHRALELDPSQKELEKTLKNLPERIKQRDVEDLRAGAISLLEQEEYEKAQEPLRRALQIDLENESIAVLLDEAQAKAWEAKIRGLRDAAKESEDRGDLEASLKAWQKLLRTAPNDAEAKKKTAKIAREDRRRRLRRMRNRTIIAAAAITLCYSLWAGLPNVQRLAAARRGADAAQFNAARQSLADCGWFLAWGKGELAEYIDNAEHKWLMKRADSCEQKGEYLAAAEGYLAALKLAPDPRIVEDKLEQLKGKALARADGLEKDQRYSTAIKALEIVEQIEKKPDLLKTGKERLAELGRQRQQALTAKAEADKSRQNARQNKAEEYAQALWADAGQSMLSGDQLLGKARFREAEAAWRTATGKYDGALEAALKKAREREAALANKRDAEQSRRDAEQSRRNAERAGAKKDAPALWKQGQTLFDAAQRSFDQNDFGNASRTWKSAAAEYAKAEKYAAGVASVRKGKAKYNAELAKYGEARLKVCGGEAWAQVEDAVAAARKARNDFAAAAVAYRRAADLLPEADHVATKKEPVFAVCAQRGRHSIVRLDIEDGRFKRRTIQEGNYDYTGDFIKFALPKCDWVFADKAGKKHKVAISERCIDNKWEWANPRIDAPNEANGSVSLLLMMACDDDRKEVRTERSSTKWVRKPVRRHDGTRDSYDSLKTGQEVHFVNSQHWDLGVVRFVARRTEANMLFIFVFRLDYGKGGVPTEVEDPEELFGIIPTERKKVPRSR